MMKAWLIGLAISIFAVVCTFIAYTPVALVGIILSVPMLPGMFIFDLVTRGRSMGDITMSIASLIFFGSFVYGGIALLVVRILRSRHDLRTR